MQICEKYLPGYYSAGLVSVATFPSLETFTWYFVAGVVCKEMPSVILKKIPYEQEVSDFHLKEDGSEQRHIRLSQNPAVPLFAF